MSEQLKQLSAITALNEMMAGNHFNICVIDRIAEMLARPVRGSEAYTILGPLHCVNWAKMPPELRDAIPSLIEQCLGIAPAFQFKTVEPNRVIDITPPREAPKPERRSLLRLLTTRGSNER